MSDDTTAKRIILARVLVEGSEVNIICEGISNDDTTENNLTLTDCRDLKFELEGGNLLDAVFYSIPKKNLLSYAVGKIIDPSPKEEEPAKEEPAKEEPAKEEPAKKKRGRPKKNIGEVLDE